MTRVCIKETVMPAKARTATTAFGLGGAEGPASALRAWASDMAGASSGRAHVVFWGRTQRDSLPGDPANGALAARFAVAEVHETLLDAYGKGDVDGCRAGRGGDGGDLSCLDGHAVPVVVGPVWSTCTGSSAATSKPPWCRWPARRRPPTERARSRIPMSP